MPDSPAFSIEGSIFVSFHVIDGVCICIKDTIQMGDKRGAALRGYIAWICVCEGLRRQHLHSYYLEQCLFSSFFFFSFSVMALG